MSQQDNNYQPIPITHTVTGVLKNILSLKRAYELKATYEKHGWAGVQIAKMLDGYNKYVIFGYHQPE